MSGMNERCGNCLYQSELVLWEENVDGYYIPNYNKRLTCCAAFVGLDDGTNLVYGHTRPHDDGFCECWTRRHDLQPTCNQKQVASKLESVEIPTDREEKSTIGQPKSKLDLISRSDTIKALCRECDFGKEGCGWDCTEVEVVRSMPSIPSEHKAGEWVGYDECSLCGKQAYDFIEGYVEGVEYLPNYCPNCGAKMTG